MPDPRPDSSNVDLTGVVDWVSQIAYVIYQDADDLEIAEQLRAIDRHLCLDPEMYSVVFDQLCQMKVISKAQWRAYLDLRDPRL